MYGSWTEIAVLLRPILRFYGAYLFRKRGISIFKSSLIVYFGGMTFKNQFFKNHSKTTKKNVTNFLQSD